MELTPWFPPEIKPVHKGVYETSETSTGPCFNYWNGKFWCWTRPYPEAAFDWKDDKSAVQENTWRGLARKP